MTPVLEAQFFASLCDITLNHSLSYAYKTPLALIVMLTQNAEDTKDHNAKINTKIQWICIKLNNPNKYTKESLLNVLDGVQQNYIHANQSNTKYFNNIF